MFYNIQHLLDRFKEMFNFIEIKGESFREVKTQAEFDLLHEEIKEYYAELAMSQVNGQQRTNDKNLV